MTTATRSLLVKLSDGTVKKIHGIPANAKVTFGKVQPGQTERGYPTTEAYALRIYTTANNQLAVFTGVKEFRDLTLRIETQVKETKRKGKSTVMDGEIVAHDSESQQYVGWETE